MDPDPKEFAMADEGPVAAALRWAGEIVDSRDIRPWHAHTETLKRWFVQQWLTLNPTALDHPAAGSRSRDGLVDVLVGADGPDNELFQHMWRVIRRDIAGALAPFGRDDLTAGTRPRTVSPGIEAVRFFRASDMTERDGTLWFDDGASAPSLVILLSHEQGQWLVASVGSWLPVLGWPPQTNELPDTVIDG